ncbi:hypothetical protein [Sphingobium sp. YR768]|jgi:hypothetical protein|uniref:hypothetical protein n=1 Tax=Sphingobium sp. YR768 TaxID=1884365 RepID=UPI0008C706D7|nr:hypothetical protein [Sphingobium sp. YR768]SER28710.1 hypothetical protein SAMN05518866_1088 [Sphingobium sp. YR768]
MKDVLMLSAAPELIGLFNELVPTLPLSYRPVLDVSGDRGDVHLAFGEGDWTEAVVAAAEAGACCVMVVNPAPCPPEQIDALIDQVEPASTRIFLSEAFACDPAVALLRARLPERATICDFAASCTMDIERAVFDQMRLARALAMPISTIVDSVETRSSALLTCRTPDNTPIRLTVSPMVTDRQHRHRFRAFGADWAARLDLYGDQNARPAVASIIDAQGMTRIPTVYETAHRSMLRAIHGGLGASHQYLRNFAADSLLAVNLTPA